jgi:hypothetical protein
VVAKVLTGEVISCSAKAVALYLSSVAWFFHFHFESLLAFKVGLTSATMMKLASDRDS